MKRLIVQAGRKDVLSLDQVTDILQDIIKKENIASVSSIKKPKTSKTPSTNPLVKIKSPSIKPSVPTAPKQHPNVRIRYPDSVFHFMIQAQYVFEKKVVNLQFKEINLSDTTFSDVMKKLNVKRKFLFDKRVQDRIK